MKQKKMVFVIMPFTDNTIQVKCKHKTKSVSINYTKEFEKLKKVITKEFKNKYSVERSNIQYDNNIYRKIHKGLNSADVVIADLTMLNPNVLYELGIRHALKDKKTIMAWRKCIGCEYPFDLNKYDIWEWSEMLKNVSALLKNNKNDSPVREYINIDSPEEDKDIFEGYENIRDKFNNEYHKYKTIRKRYEVVCKYLYLIKEDEAFDQKHAFVNYKIKGVLTSSEESISILCKSLKIIEKYSPKNSNNHETIGLSCSISRKLYELTKKPRSNEYRMKSFDYSRHFISNFKSSYAYSSYALHLIAQIEKNDIEKEYFVQEVNFLIQSFNTDYEYEEYDSHYLHTKRLLLALVGDKVHINKKDCEFMDDDFSWKSSDETYERARSTFNLYIKE